jgi:2-C-methyl-D-erythritol 2,4-cyclodiphosphate synthase
MISVLDFSVYFALCYVAIIRRVARDLRMRVGIGHDTHRLVEGRPLVLGGVSIAHTHGLAGHSDADAVLHAVADALLGAAALGDIGELFPDTDPQYHASDSAILLSEVVRRVRAAGWRTVNMDLIIHAERPKLGPHKIAMRHRIAELLEVAPERVSVKAKTGELVGPIGRGEAISCEAVVLLEQEPAQEV